MKCKICKYPLQSLKSYIAHVHKHKNANVLLPCAFEGCMQSFKTLSSLRSLLSLEHRTLLNVRRFSHVQTANITLVCCVTFCRQICSDLSLLLDHLSLHLKKNEEIKCPFRNCSKSFKLKSSLTGHLSRNHRHASTCHLSDECVVDAQLPLPSSSHSIQNTNTVTFTAATSGEDENTDLSSSEFTETLAMFYLKLIAKHHVASAVIQMITEELTSIQELHVKNVTNILRVELVKNEINTSVIDNILEHIDDADLVRQIHLGKGELRSNFSRRQYFHKQFQYIHPVSYQLGYNKRGRACCFQYVPIKKSLAALLQNESVLKQFSNKYPHTNDVHFDYTDGTIYQESEMCNRNTYLEILLYQDSFEIVNPLGSAKKKHKILAMYYTLGNLHPWFRSKIDPMQLVLLCRQMDFDTFGPEKIFRPLIEDLKILENGVDLSSEKQYKGIIFAIIGDNLGSHTIGGFVENFSTSTYHCRYCLVPKNEMFVNCFYLKAFENRTKINYQQSVELLNEDSTLHDVYGVKFNSIFNELRTYHVCNPGLPPCLGHDLFEGVVSYDVFLCIKYFVKDRKWINSGNITKKILHFPYKGMDKRDTPCEFSITCEKLTGHAVQNWNFLRFFPLIISNAIKDFADPVWQMLIVLHELVELVCAPKIAVNQVYYLRDLIEEYLEMRSLLFPLVKLRPKNHFLLHYPGLILKFGPLIRMWTMRFESKHSYFKTCARHSHNFKNITQTLSERHQLLQAYSFTGSMFRNILMENPTPFHLDFYDVAIKNCIVESFGRLHQETYISDKVEFRGTSYKRNMFLILSRHENNLIFGEIIFMILSKDDLYFIVKVSPAVHSHIMNLYILEEIPHNKFQCILATDILDYYPLESYKMSDKMVIVLKHGVLDTFV